MLVVEDSPTQAQFLQMALEDMGMAVESSPSLASALRRIRQGELDAIMLDLILPDSNGLDTLIKVDVEAPRTPIIVLTGLEDESLGVEALKNGAEDYLLKSETSASALGRSIRYAIERKKTAVALCESERKVRRIMERAYDAFVALDTSGTIIEWNKKAERLFGWSRLAATGRNFFNILLPERYRQLLSDGVKEYLSTGSGNIVNKRIELTGLHRNGHEFPLELALFPVQVGSTITLCSFVTDISERKEVERRMSEFYSIVSHELRSPLTALRGSLGLIEGGQVGELTDETAELIAVGRESCDRLIRLVNDLLDLSKIEAGKLELKIAEADPVALVDMTIDYINGMAMEAGIRLSTDVNAEHLIRADADRLLQVLMNLVSNAIKFSPANSQVTVRVEEVEDRVRFSVVDQGPGIPDAQLPKLFAKFQQLDSSDSRRHAGTGLGLAISKAIVAQHRGQIGVKSAPGKGSTFWFEVPTAN